MDLNFRLDSDFLSTDIPGGLDVLNEFALSDGKRFRPLLLMKMAQCLSIPLEIVAPFAVAAERIHNATLLHDDVVDDSRTRRGRATMNAFGENRKAILGGDLLLARTLRDLGLSRDVVIIQDLFDVLVDLTEGEWLQLEARGRFDVEGRHLRAVARKKTGSLIGWCCATPLRLRRDRHETVQIFKEFGVLIGTAFQLFDDCLDFDASSGKPYAQDLREGQINFVTQDLLETAPDLRSQLKSRFLVNSPAPFSNALDKAIASSLKRVLERAEIEIGSARAQLLSAGLSTAEQKRIESEVLVPFLSQLKKAREKMK